MQHAFETIPARTERQAMDWSLVLVSQGIDATIERDPDANTWQLVVNAPDYPRAIRAIRQYHTENKRRIWRHELPLPWTGLVFDWRSAFVMLFLVFVFATEATGHGDLQSAGMMDNKLVHAGQWWRLFSAVTLHGDLAHLAANVTTGLLLLGLAMGTFGPGFGLLAAYLAGAGGNLAGLLIYSQHRGLGASGMVMGALGLLAAQSLGLLRHGLTHHQLVLRGVASGCLLLVLLGFSPRENVDVLAHVGGFVVGLFLGGLLALGPSRFTGNIWANRVALVAVVGLSAVSWFLALRGP